MHSSRFFLPSTTQIFRPRNGLFSTVPPLLQRMIFSDLTTHRNCSQRRQKTLWLSILDTGAPWDNSLMGFPANSHSSNSIRHFQTRFLIAKCRTLGMRHFLFLTPRPICSNPRYPTTPIFRHTISHLQKPLPPHRTPLLLPPQPHNPLLVFSIRRPRFS